MRRGSSATKHGNSNNITDHTAVSVLQQSLGTIRSPLANYVINCPAERTKTSGAAYACSGHKPRFPMIPLRREKPFINRHRFGRRVISSILTNGTS